jgi:hypothetical protein
MTPVLWINLLGQEEYEERRSCLGELRLIWRYIDSEQAKAHPTWSFQDFLYLKEVYKAADMHKYLPGHIVALTASLKRGKVEEA